MADIVLSGKITRIGEGRMVNGNNGQVACLDFDMSVSRGGKKRVDLMDSTKQYSNDFYRCTIWGEKALALHKILGGQTGRIVQISGTLLEDAFPRTGDVFIGTDNPMFGFISQFGNPSYGITFDQARNGFWIKGTYAYKTYNVNVEKFTLLDYAQNQQPTGFSNTGNNGGSQQGFNQQGGGTNWNTNAGLGNGQANTGFNSPAQNQNTNANQVFAQTSTFGQNTQAQANTGFNQASQQTNTGFNQGAQQGNDAFTQASSQNSFNQAPAQDTTSNTGFVVIDDQAPTQDVNAPGFIGNTQSTTAPATGFNTVASGGVDTNIPAPSEFTPDTVSGEPQAF